MSTMSNGLRGITERPSAGELDYTELLKHFPANCPLVWELSPTREAAEIKESMKIQEGNVSGTELTLIQFTGVNR